MARGYRLRRTVTFRTLVGLFCGITFGLLTGLYNQRNIIECSGMDYLLAVHNSAQSSVPSLETWKRLYNTHNVLPATNQSHNVYSYHQVKRFDNSAHKPETSPRKNLVLIGVMTAAKYLQTRAISTSETWARNVPGDVIYFSSEGSESLAPPGFPVIGLKGVDDSYPPQKKSFLMLKYMYEYYGSKYKWFMRVDDDIYVKGNKLELFLSSINSSLPQFIGQAGLGNQAEFGTLSLDKKENYCMGGPGMVFSALTLEKIAPYVSDCLQNLYSTHEDVEIGRCVSKFAKVSCTWAYEMQALFYHNHKEPNGSFTSPLRSTEIGRAITLHPVKNYEHQYRIHTHFLAMRAQHLRHRTVLLQRAILDMDSLLQETDHVTKPGNHVGRPLSLVQFIPNTREEILSWDFVLKSHYSFTNLNPKQSLDNSVKPGLEDVIRQVMENINRNARQRGRTIDFKELLYGYRRVDPLHGANYILDLLLVYRKHKGRKMTIPVRRHAYLQQTFAELEFREDPYTEDFSPAENYLNEHNVEKTTPNRFVDVIQNQLNIFALSNSKDQGAQGPDSIMSYSQTKFEDKVLYFILTVSGRYEKFEAFMLNYESVVLKQERRSVVSVMLFHHDTEDRTDDMQNLIARYQRAYPQHQLTLKQVEGPFSRGLGLEKGGLLHAPDALLVFIDVDMYLHKDLLNRIKLNTIQGKQVFFPAVFSQFDPALYCNASCVASNMYPTPFHYSDVAGYWRIFGFGIAAMYNSDFQKVGGFDKDIDGWGSEDVKLYETFIKRNYSMFRSAEPGLVHIYHSIHCDADLESSQYRMCLGTKASTYASISKLSELVYANKAIYHRNEQGEDLESMRRVAQAPRNVPAYLQKGNGVIPQIRKPGS